MLSIAGMAEGIATTRLMVATGPLFDYYPYEQGVFDAFHWRLGDFKHTLLDLTIRRSDQAIVGVTLTIFAGRVLEQVPLALQMAACVGGTPVVTELDMLSSRLDEHCELSMHLGSDRVFLLLPGELDDVMCMGTDRVAFFVASRHLVGIAFNRLLATERAGLVQMVGEPRV
jgi:hypothetical protein